MKRVSTGSALYRHAMGAAIAAARAAGNGAVLATAPVDYDALQGLLRARQIVPASPNDAMIMGGWSP